MKHELRPSPIYSPELFEAIKATGEYILTHSMLPHPAIEEFEFLNELQYASNDIDNVVTLFVKVTFNVAVTTYPNNFCKIFDIHEHVEHVTVTGFISEHDICTIPTSTTITVKCS